MVQSHLEIIESFTWLKTVMLSEEIPFVQKSTLTTQVFRVQHEHSTLALYMPESENSSESLTPVTVTDLNSSRVC